jgi:hypothetical protein
VQAIAHEGLLPFQYVVANCLYGNSPGFWDTIDACVGVKHPGPWPRHRHLKGQRTSSAWS